MARLRHLVVVIPGIGGSVLTEPDQNGQADGRVRYDLSKSGLSRALLFPQRLDLDSPADLVATDLVDDLTLIAPLVIMSGYSKLSVHLANAFDQAVISTYRPGRVPPDVDVLRFPYDFRRSVTEAAQQLDAAVGEALKDRPATVNGKRPVIIVAHSMGGLVARYWAAVLGGWQRCHALLLLGTPHRGAPKALDWLVNGAGAGRLRYSPVTRVIRGWPSVYELLPQYEAVVRMTASGGLGDPFELTELPPGLAIAEPQLPGYAGRFAALAKDGRKTHEAIAGAWEGIDPDRRPQVLSYLGRGHGTLNMAVIDGGQLTVSKADPPWRGNAGWGGDGTVPMLCAIPREQRDRQDLWREMPDRHGDLGSIPEPVDVLRLYSGDRVPVRGGDLPDRPWVGFDAEEFVAEGEDCPVAVRLLPATLTGEQAWITRSPTGGSPAPEYRTRLTPGVGGPDTGGPDGAGPGGAAAWHGTLPGCPAGTYRLTAEVTGVPGHGSVSGTAVIAVVGVGPVDSGDEETAG